MEIQFSVVNHIVSDQQAKPKIGRRYKCEVVDEGKKIFSSFRFIFNIYAEEDNFATLKTLCEIKKKCDRRRDDVKIISCTLANEILSIFRHKKGEFMMPDVSGNVGVGK